MAYSVLYLPTIRSNLTSKNLFLFQSGSDNNIRCLQKQTAISGECHQLLHFILGYKTRTVKVDHRTYKSEWLLQRDNPLFSEDQDAKKINYKLMLKSTVVFQLSLKANFMILCSLISDLGMWQYWIYSPSKGQKVNLRSLLLTEPLCVLERSSSPSLPLHTLLYPWLCSLQPLWLNQLLTELQQNIRIGCFPQEYAGDWHAIPKFIATWLSKHAFQQPEDSIWFNSLSEAVK